MVQNNSITIDDLLKFYKDNLTFEGTVIRANGLMKYILIYLLLLVFVGFVISFTITQNYVYGIIAIIFIILFVLVGKIISARFIKAKYPTFWVSWTSWSNLGFNNMFLDRLEQYLKDVDDNKLDKIQELIKERASRSRVSSIVFVSTFVGLSIPFWSLFLNSVLDPIKSAGLEALCPVFLMMLFLITSISFLTPLLLEIRDDFITRYAKWNNLNDLISNMRLKKR